MAVLLCAGSAAVQPAIGADAWAAMRTVGASPTIAQNGDQRWEPPLGRPLRIAEAYRPPPNPYSAGHRGVDISAAPGIEVRAPAGGTISFSGVVVDRPVVSIQVDERTVISLEPVVTELRKGDAVVRGQLLGTAAIGAHCDDHCVHLGVRIDGEYVNPMRFFFERPVLLPW